MIKETITFSFEDEAQQKRFRERLAGDAWSHDMARAPIETHILVRHPEWECPAVMRFTCDFSAVGEWVFCDSVLMEMHGELVTTEGCEWTFIPK